MTAMAVATAGASQRILSPGPAGHIHHL